MASYLLIGGVRSGKSAWAVNYAKNYKKKTFIATATPCDHEMERRILYHQQERGEGWTTIEAGTNIIDAFRQAVEQSDCIVVDCLTLWTASIMNDGDESSEVIDKWVNPVLDVVKTTPSKIILVTNEVGMGVHPEYETGRKYRDLLGLINQYFARVCDNVLWLAAGIPIVLKGALPKE